MFPDVIKLDIPHFRAKSKLTIEKSIAETNWSATNTFRYLLCLKNRVERKEIVAGA